MMFTNAFRVGGLHTVSWFQLIPGDDTSRKPPDESATRSLLAAHIQLKNEGHLTSWTFSSSEKGRKVKLWLFFPGRLERPNLDESLKVSKYGIWQCPGNSTEVTAALCEALRNRVERALSTLSYVRFGAMFIKCKRQLANDSDFRRTLPSCELAFAASEEALFVHIRVHNRRMRPLAAGDVRAVLTQHTNTSTSEKPAVVVAPYGLTGWLTGCCPGDLVRQLTQSKLETSGIRTQFPTTKDSAFLSRSWYVEVRMKFLLAKGTPLREPGAPKSLLQNEYILEDSQWIEKLFIFPPEAILIPTVPPVPARAYLRRCWLRRLAGTDWLEEGMSLRGFSPLTSLQGHRLQAMGKSNTIWKLNSNSSKSSTSSGSGGSSIKSSDSRGSSGSESDVNDGEYREDADSAAAKIDAMVSASDVDSKRAMGSGSLKRGREPGRNNLSHKVSRKSSPGALSAANNTTFEANSAVPSAPKGAGSQAGTPWDWNEEVSMQSDADFFAEFGDFGDFFEGDGFGFGEPPGTAESYMFPFDGDTPGTHHLDTSDPMLLPIMDFPMLEGFGQPEVQKEQDPGAVEDLKPDVSASPSVAVPESFSLVAKSEAALIFAVDYAPVELPASQGGLPGNSYKPEAEKSSFAATKYFYSATPPLTPRNERKTDIKRHLDVEEDRRKRETTESSIKLYKATSDLASSGKGRKVEISQFQQASTAQRKSPTPTATLATDLECAIFQVQLHNVRGLAYCAPHSEPTRPPDLSHKECSSEITDVSDCDNPLRKHDRPKKVPVPERIAGNADEVLHDGPRPVDPFVWRPVENSKQQQKPDSFKHESGVPAEAGNAPENGDTGMQEMLDLIPLLVQQASSSTDITLLGEHGGDGPLAWLTLHQKVHQQSPTVDSFSSSSDMSDPSVAEVSPATVASILHSDMRQAMTAAFGDISVAGPLSLADWSRGRLTSSFHGDIYSGDSKELSSITGEPITSPQSAASGAISKVLSLQELDSHTSDSRRGREGDDLLRRMSLDGVNTDEMSSSGVLPVPTVLVGYQDDWLKTSPSSLRYWEKAPFEPYGYPKPVAYYVLCVGLDSLLNAASDFFQQLSNMYEACKLGTHTPANSCAQTSNKRSIPGFISVDLACKIKGASTSINAANEYVSALESGWDPVEFRKSLRKACKSLAITGPPTVEGDDEHSPSTVVYVVSPTSEPSIVLQTMLEACQSLRPVLSKAKKILGINTFDDGRHLPVPGFSIGRFALQVLTPETIFRLGSSQGSGLDVLKELSFSVYVKLRRIPQKCAPPDSLQHYGASTKARFAQGTSLSGLWKDCSSNRNSGLSVLGLDAGNLRWEKSWHTPRLLEDSIASYSIAPPQASRFLFEPLFILSDGCLLEHGMGQLLHAFREKSIESAVAKNLGLTETAPSTVDGACQRSSFHCCYAWSTNWQWLIAVWTDSRGEMLDVNVIPVPRSVTEKEGNILFQLFIQVFQQGLQLLSSGVGKPHHITLTRIGELYEAEYQEWQRVLTSDDSKTWAVQIRPETDSSNQLRSLTGLASLPSSPAGPSFNSRTMLAGCGIGKSNHLAQIELQSVLSVSLATIGVDNSFQLLNMGDTSGGLASGFGMAKSVATLNGAYLFVPAHGIRYLATSDSSTCKTDVPAIAQLVQSKGLVSPVASGYVISGPCTASRSELSHSSTEEEWPSSLYVGLVAYFGNAGRQVPSTMRLVSNGMCDPALKPSSKDRMTEARSVLEQLGADLYGLSWLTLSPLYLHRRRPMPFHCGVAQRLDALLCYMHSEMTP